MSVFSIERQRSNGDWTPVGQIDSEGLTYSFPEHVLEEWLKRNDTRAERGRYRVLRSQFGSRSVDELLVGERREWVVEKVKDDPDPESEPELTKPEVIAARTSRVS